MSELVVALDVGGTDIKAGLLEADGTLVYEEHRPTRAGDRPSAVDNVIRVAGDLVVRAQDARRRVVAVGLAVPGIVDSDAGVARSSMMLGWRDVPFVDLVAAHTGLPVGLGHDVRLAAEAERAASGTSTDWLYLSIGTGVGSAVMLGGRAYTGAGGLGGELAHVLVEPDGPPCRCGKYGCLEVVGSAEAIGRRYRELAPEASTATARDVVERANAGDAVALSVWRRALRALAVGLAQYSEIMEPERIVVGGGLSRAGDLLMAPLREQLGSLVSLPHPPELRLAHFGTRAGLHGAAHAGRRAAGV